MCTLAYLAGLYYREALKYCFFLGIFPEPVDRHQIFHMKFRNPGTPPSPPPPLYLGNTFKKYHFFNASLK